MIISVDAVVAALGTAPHEDGLSYRVVLSPDDVHLAVDSAGHPSLLVPVEQSPDARNFVLGDVRLVTHEKIRFQVDGRERESAALIVTCLDRERPQSFSVFLLDLVHRLRGTSAPPLNVIESALREWHEMLTRRVQMTREQELGLWGELAVLRALPELDRGLAAWTGPSKDSVDFRGGGVALEVKTSTEPWRHTLSLEQVKQVQADYARTYLVSVWIGINPAGESLPRLVESLEAELADQVGFRRRLLQAGYAHEQHALYEDAFALQREPVLIEMGDVPRVRQVDPGVSRVRFTVSLENCEKLAPQAATEILRQLVTRKDDDEQR